MLLARLKNLESSSDEGIRKIFPLELVDDF
jgi:hypothetical protein